MTDRTVVSGRRPAVHFVLWGTGLGGSETITSQYVNEFYDRWDLFAFNLRDPRFEIFDDSKVRITYGHRRNWRCWPVYFRYCRRHRTQIFHLVNVGPIILLITLLAGVKKPIYHIHETRHWKSSFKKPVLLAFWRLCSFFEVQYIANSRHCAAEFRRQVLPTDTLLIYNGFEVDRFLARRTLRRDLRRIGYLGRFAPGKNVELVIRLFEEVAAARPGLKLLLAGDGPLRPVLEERVKSSPFRERITMQGWIEDVAAFYADVDLLVLVSASESFGNVVAEATLTGLPVLTSNLPVFTEIHDKADRFCIGAPQDYQQLRDNFLSAVGQYPELAKLAWEASGYVAETFNLKKHLAAIEDLYVNY